VKTELKVKKNKILVNKVIKLGNRNTIIVILGCKGSNLKSTSILLSKGIRMSGKKVSFYNLDENTKFPSFMPNDEKANIVVVHCLLEQANLLKSFPQTRRINLLVIDNKHCNIENIYKALNQFCRITKNKLPFYCLGVNVENINQWIELFKNLRKMILPSFDNFSLRLLGNIPISPKIVYFENSNYSIDHFRPALTPYEDIISEIRAIISL